LDDLPTDLPCPDSQDVTSDWLSLLVHNVKKLEDEKHILRQKVAQLEAELESTREQIEELKEKSKVACQLALNFSFEI
jgi:predicted  nucleic acid-binding Zn-ribbon protein